MHGTDRGDPRESFSQRQLGYSVDPVLVSSWPKTIRDHLRTELVAEALVMAIGQRVPEPGLLHHSDQGSQYGSDDYRRLLAAHRIACSMSRRGNCWDNAVVESFFATLKPELIYRCSWPTRDEATASIHEWIENFYERPPRPNQPVHGFGAVPLMRPGVALLGVGYERDIGRERVRRCGR
jgi:hypothetical protein